MKKILLIIISLLFIISQVGCGKASVKPIDNINNKNNKTIQSKELNKTQPEAKSQTEVNTQTEVKTQSSEGNEDIGESLDSLTQEIDKVIDSLSDDNFDIETDF